jgi:hypothetical protein
MLAFELGEKLSPRFCAAARKAFFPFQQQKAFFILLGL